MRSNLRAASAKMCELVVVNVVSGPEFELDSFKVSSVIGVVDSPRSGCELTPPEKGVKGEVYSH